VAINTKTLIMIKNELHTISDNDAIEVGKILLKTPTSNLYEFTFEKITRISYDHRDGVDAEESVNVYFKAIVKNDLYRKSGWKDESVSIKLIESDNYHNYPYFSANANNIQDPKITWSHKFLSNHIEAIEYLQKIQKL